MSMFTKMPSTEVELLSEKYKVIRKRESQPTKIISLIDGDTFYETLPAISYEDEAGKVRSTDLSFVSKRIRLGDIKLHPERYTITYYTFEVNNPNFIQSLVRTPKTIALINEKPKSDPSYFSTNQ